MNQEQVRELLELLRQINQALARIEKLLADELRPAVGRDRRPQMGERRGEIVFDIRR